MIEIRFHGRGGQGAVTAARMLAEAAFLEGKYAQAFPFFGAERRGAPVVSFARIDTKPVRIRSQIYEPDHVVVLDSTLLKTVNVTEGLKPGGLLVVNARQNPKLSAGRTVWVDATSIAVEEIGAPITNMAMLGAYVRASGEVGLESVLTVVGRYFKGKLGERNLRAIRRAYEEARE
ncbi:MAG: pyruvate ferredoxin oxidoreductase [Hadesarchaea archaeon]|nr:MAG: pyruvate ferredoxin oxidoreductase [Hadesarchaea archaeon]TDA34456.1 MAG: pyruvate ferredoxin oxidoreductase [Hadesarchaea archaeon]